MKWCRWTGKMRHPTRSAAGRHLAGMRKDGRPHRGLEVFRCNACGDWHLGRRNGVGHSPAQRRRYTG